MKVASILTDEEAIRFWAKYNWLGDCLIGPKQFWRDGHNASPRLIAWLEAGNEPTDKAYLPSFCRNACFCINPAHLVPFEGQAPRGPKPRPKALPRPRQTPEERRARAKAYRERNRERRNAHLRNIYLKDSERFRAAVRDYKSRNPEKRTYAHQVLGSPNAEAIKLRRASNNQLRKARIRGGEWEFVDMAVLLKRDHQTCSLCGEGPSEDRWSMDHVIPVSRGGMHLYSNIKLAHFRCNARKNNRVAA